MDWFFENYIDSLPCPILEVDQVLLSLLEWSLTLSSCPHGLLSLLDIILQLGEHLYPGYEVLEVSWRVECQVLPEPLTKSHPELIARHRQLLGAFLNLVLHFLIPSSCR